MELKKQNNIVINSITVFEAGIIVVVFAFQILIIEFPPFYLFTFLLNI